MKTMPGPAVPGHAEGRRTAGPAVAGLAYAATWVAALVIGPASLEVTAPGAAVVRAYAGQQGAAIAQLVLTEGVAAVALAMAVLALGRAARGRGADRMAARIEVAGLAAVVLSLVQCVHGVRLAGWVAPGGDSSRASSLFQFISRIDGVKMLLLAALVASGMALVRRAGALPPRPDFPGVVLTAALTGGGVGYLLLSPALAWMAWMSLPLLLIWMPGMGLWLSLGPAQANGSRRLAAWERGDGGLPQLPPAEAGHSPHPRALRTPRTDPSRAYRPGQRQLRAGATDVKSPAADRQPVSGRRGGCPGRDLVTARHSRPPGRLPGQSQPAGNTRPGCRPHDQGGDGDVHPVSITAAR